jgi:hypothetical protein
MQAFVRTSKLKEEQPFFKSDKKRERHHRKTTEYQCIANRKAVQEAVRSVQI